MTTTTPTLDVIEFSVPLPPVVLRANGRAHYRVKGRAADAYSQQVFYAFIEADARQFNNGSGFTWIEDIRWPAAHVTYTWRYSGVAPDHGNLGGNTKYLQDILCMAPKSKAGKNRWYLGLCEDDKYITAEYHSEKVPTRGEECVIITIRRLPDGTKEHTG